MKTGSRTIIVILEGTSCHLAIIHKPEINKFFFNFPYILYVHTFFTWYLKSYGSQMYDFWPYQNQNNKTCFDINQTTETDCKNECFPLCLSQVQYFLYTVNLWLISKNCCIVGLAIWFNQFVALCTAIGWSIGSPMLKIIIIIVFVV